MQGADELPLGDIGELWIDRALNANIQHRTLKDAKM
jgi:hypothetical protein